jgi:hypothetical protein
MVALILCVEDRLVWRWSASGVHSASSTCSAMFLGQTQLLECQRTVEDESTQQIPFFLMNCASREELDLRACLTARSP